MRGAPGNTSGAVTAKGIIPADAGSTHAGSVPSRAREDHPRGCGEHKLLIIKCCAWKGSSPRMRGARRQLRHDGTLSGIIPADAGSTCLRQAPRATIGDHPRGCGEHVSCGRHCGYLCGSSPRMRGAPTRGGSNDIARRIIPADAGSTQPRTTRTGLRRDHPRGCGEHR